MNKQYTRDILLSRRMLQDSSLHFMAVPYTSLIPHVLIKQESNMNTRGISSISNSMALSSLLDICIIHELSFVTSKVLLKSKW